MKDYKFVHIRPVDPRARGACSVGYVRTSDTTVTAAVARCNPKDNFSKKIAHSIIAGRFNNEEYYHIEITPNNPVVPQLIFWADKKGFTNHEARHQ